MSDINYRQIIIKLTSLESHYPNLCTMWKYYLTEKKRGYIRSLEQCTQVISALENENIQENIDEALPLLCIMLHNNLLT